MPCPVPPPCSELCKSRLAVGSHPYRPLAPRGGPMRGSSVSSLQTAQQASLKMPSLQTPCEWPQTPRNRIKSEFPDSRVGKPPCFEGLLRASEGLQPGSRPLLASQGRDRLPCSLTGLGLWSWPEYGCPRLPQPPHCTCYALPTASAQLWSVGGESHSTTESSSEAASAARPGSSFLAQNLGFSGFSMQPCRSLLKSPRRPSCP